MNKIDPEENKQNQEIGIRTWWWACIMRCVFCFVVPLVNILMWEAHGLEKDRCFNFVA